MSQSILLLENGGVRLYCERRGTGARAILFAHGWISSRRMWYEVVERLDPGEFTMYLLDFRGCGLSDRPRNAESHEAYAADLRTALDAIGSPATIVGHSMGGRLAQYVATQRPSNLERLILVASGTAKTLRLTPGRNARALQTYGSRAQIERFQRAAMRRDVAPAVMERIVEDALVASYDHWAGVETRGAADFSGALARIDVPVLAIAGAEDPLAPPAQVKREVAGAIEGALFVQLRDAGHNLPIETPDDIAEAVRRFGQ